MSGCSMVRGSKRGTIGTRKRRSWGSNCISKGFAQAIEHRNAGLVGRLPSTRFFLLEKLNLPSPVRTAATPKMEGEAVLLAGEGTQFRDVKPNPLGRNQELEGAIMQEGNMKMRGRAANGGLEDGAHRGGIQTKLARPKSNNQRKGSKTKNRVRNRQNQKTADVILDLKARSKREPRQGHG